MKHHDWIVETLKEIAGFTRDRRMGGFDARLETVAEVYASEFSSSEIEQQRVFDYLMVEAGVISVKQVNHQ